MGMTSNELEQFKQSILDSVRVMMQTTGQVTQYVGARYEPLFADPIEWSDQKEYEPLTIVTHQGNSFTSRQFVPKGIGIDNPEFWASTGNFNAQIEQYRKEVAAFDARITAAQNAADSKAPINHASESTEYGVGNAVNYGHVKLADVDTPMDSSANDGIAATPKFISESIINSKNIRTIEDYGCSTSLSDNSEKLQAAINDCAENGYILIIPKGTYICTSPVSIPWHTYMFGCGKESVIKFTSDNGFFSPTDKNGYNVSVDVCIKHMSVIGPLSTVSKTYNDTHAGFYGMFTSCEMEDLFIKNFEVGIKLNQNVQPPDYNGKYNHVFGDLKSWKNISVDSCNMGIKNTQWDTFFDTVTIATCWNSMITGYFVNNLHVWGCRAGIYCETGYFNNVEIESQTMYNDIAESFIIINTNNVVTLNNVRLWNVIMDNPTISYSHAYIRGDNAHNGVAIINNLVISEDQDEPTKLKKPVINLNNLKAIVQGGITNKITELATGFGGAPTSVSIGGNGYALGNILANFELPGAINVSGKTGYHTVTTS